MNDLQIFKSPEFGQVRILMKDGQPYFIGKDIAEILKYSNTRKALIDHIDEEDKGVTKCDTLGGTQEMTIINESGLYSLILGSKLPTAKKFKHWVTSEILPQIRQTGGYIPSGEHDTDDDIMAKALLIAQKKIQLKNRAIAEKESQLQEQQPKVDFANHIASSENSLLVRETAKIISKKGIVIGEKKLYRKLREWGLVFKNSCEATQKAVNQNLMEVIEGTKESSKGVFTYKTSRVTGKGQIYIINRLLKEQES